jgi:hypothetical protein
MFKIVTFFAFIKYNNYIVYSMDKQKNEKCRIKSVPKFQIEYKKIIIIFD